MIHSSRRAQMYTETIKTSDKQNQDSTGARTKRTGSYTLETINTIKNLETIIYETGSGH